MKGIRGRILMASGIAAVFTAALLPGSGVGSARPASLSPLAIPSGLASAIHARFGATPIRNSPERGARFSFGPQLGITVAISADGTTAVVGAVGTGKKYGAAYVYHVSDAGTWASTDKPTAVLSNNNKSTPVGPAISADGTTIFVGAPGAGGGDNPPGAIYVFHVASEDAWVTSSTPSATLTVPGSVYFGFPLAVSADGTTLVAGAPNSNVDAGGAYVFHAPSEDTWATTSIPNATLTNGNESRDDQFVGSGVAISGDGLTILLSDGYNPAGGGAYVYHSLTEDTWTTSAAPTAILTNAFSGGDDRLGYSVSLSGDGTVALLGAPATHRYVGAADIFHVATSSDWVSSTTPTAVLSLAKKKPAFFGYGVSLSSDGATALLGAPVSNRFRGGAAIFHVADSTAWATSSTPTATLTNAKGFQDDILGLRIALSGDGKTALLGAPGVRFFTGNADVFHTADAAAWTSIGNPAILSDADLEVCLVPGLVGLKLSEAKAALKHYNCRVGRVKRVTSATKKWKPGRVVGQGKRPGARLKVGTKVGLKVAK